MVSLLFDTAIRGPNATCITVASEQAFKLAGAIKAPLPKIKFDENFRINTESYGGNVTFTIPLQVFAEVQTGKQVLAINVRFQVCNEFLIHMAGNDGWSFISFNPVRFSDDSDYSFLFH